MRVPAGLPWQRKRMDSRRIAYMQRAPQINGPVGLEVELAEAWPGICQLQPLKCRGAVYTLGLKTCIRAPRSTLHVSSVAHQAHIGIWLKRYAQEARTEELSSGANVSFKKRPPEVSPHCPPSVRAVSAQWPPQWPPSGRPLKMGVVGTSLLKNSNACMYVSY